MSVNYIQTKLKKGSSDSFAGVLADLEDTFAEQHLSVLGEGFSDIIANPVLWESYRDGLCKEMSSDEVESMEMLIDNGRVSMLQENSVAGITPVSALSMPMLRKLWPKLGLKNALITEVVQKPKFTVSFMRPYLERDGQRHYLPEALRDGGSASALVEGTGLYSNVIKLADFDTGAGVVDGAAKGFKLLETPNLPTGVSTVIGDSIDPDFRITTVEMTVTATTAAGQARADVAGVGNVGTDPYLQEVAFTQVEGSLEGRIFAKMSAYSQYDIDPATGQPETGSTLFEDNLVGHVDFRDGVLVLANTAGIISGVKINGRLNVENNVRSDSVGFDNTNQELTIGTGESLNAPLKTQFIQDMNALYDIDAAAKILETMTSVFGLKLDQEKYQFIRDSFLASPAYDKVFDLQPLATFSGTPKDWKEMIRDMIDHMASSIKQDNNFTGGKFCIVGNELDIAVIPNVSWQFVGGNTQERSGVKAEYSIGAMSGNCQYTVLSSPQIPKGYIYVYYLNEDDDHISYRYYPYAYNVENGYNDPNQPNVPSIMVNKRHRLEAFRNAIGRIQIKNNDGDYTYI